MKWSWWYQILSTALIVLAVVTFATGQDAARGWALMVLGYVSDVRAAVERLKEVSDD